MALSSSRSFVVAGVLLKKLAFLQVVVGFRLDLEELAPQPKKIIEVSSQYHNNRKFADLESCNLPCTQASSLADADVVYAYTGSTAPTRTHEDQVWVGTFWESPEHYPARGRDFDYSFSWRPDATFPHYDMIPDTMVDMFDEKLQFVRKESAWPRRVPFVEKSKMHKKISVWISNCFLDKMHRLDVADGLDKAGVSFASFGGCKHNANPGDDSLAQIVDDPILSSFLERTFQEPNHRDADQYDASSKHLFFFAAENSKCAYYHTEKVYHALLSGSIPVYVGNGKTIDEFVPKGSVIKAADFKTTQDLAEYLKRVATNETLYNSFFDWQNQDLSLSSPAFRAKLLTRRPGGGLDRCAECAFFHTHGRNKAFDGKVLGCDA